MIQKASFLYHNQTFLFNPIAPLDISIPIQVGKENVNCYYASPVQLETIRMGDFIGDVSQGGSVNYKQLTITPHGNGTHTECYAHISADDYSIHQCLERFLFYSRLISITPKQKENKDQVIDFEDFLTCVGDSFNCEAVIIRTLPNNDSKQKRQYSGTNPPYLDHRICEYLAKEGVKHLLVDLPSVDKEVDEGKLLAHKAFWQMFDSKSIRKDASITELVYVPSSIPDGDYLLNLQIISLNADASPSKPILYTIKPA